MANRKNLKDTASQSIPRRYNSYVPSKDHQARQADSAEVISEEKRPKLWKKILLSLVILIFGFIIFVGLWDIHNISSAERKMFGTGNVLDFLNSISLKGEDRGRVNLLLVGYSIDDPGHPAAKLTDSIILLSMNTTDKTGYMLSIPRDLYVKIPGFGYAKINEAYQDGGISLLEEVISNNLNEPIDYYALVNYATVRETVNALGGITINIQSSDPMGLYDPNISPHDGGPLKLSNGLQTLDGQTALNLTRARGDAYGSYGFAQADFDRTQHQRQVLTAIKSRLNWKLILNPRKNSQILNAVASNVKTDITSVEVRPIFNLFNGIPNPNLQSIGLRNLNGKNYLSSYITAYGQSALIPTAGIDDFSKIDAILQQLDQQ